MNQTKRISAVTRASAAAALRVRRRIFLATGIVLFTATTASAGPLYVNFCPANDTCPTGVTEASLLIEEADNLLNSGDLNDYNVTLTITGDSTAPAYVDEVSFIISGIRWDNYELMELTSAPATGATWKAYFDNVSGSPGSCLETTGQQQAVCGQSMGKNNYGGVLPGETLVWTFYVDLADEVGPLSTANSLNLRAQFLDSNGRNAGILSPDGNTTSVPEPSTLALLGLALLGLASTRGRDVRVEGALLSSNDDPPNGQGRRSTEEQMTT